jgi:polyphosphate kinase 2 (PPK2 family)
VLLLKFWYHLPRAEPGKRLDDGIIENQPRWRLGAEVERLYKSYDQAIALAERVVASTSTGSAPWQVIESTDPLYAALDTAGRVLTGLKRRLPDVDLSADEPARAPEPIARPSDARSDPRADDVGERRSGVLDAVDLEARVAKEEYTKKLAKSQAKLDALFTEAEDLGLSTVIVFEGWDAAGKGGAIRRLCRQIDPRLYRVIPVGVPTAEEQSHHYLWRFWRHLPRAGHLTVFDRSWYGRVLVERVEGLADEETWRRAYEEIRDFEAQLAEANVLVLKFWLHLSPQEQLKRFEARAKTPYKKYKITDEDYRNRARWEDYELAVDDMVARTSTRACPWHLVPAEHKRVARLEVIETVRKKLGKAVKKARKQQNGASAGGAAGDAGDVQVG